MKSLVSPFWVMKGARSPNGPDFKSVTYLHAQASKMMN
jgi:hypothetical protein